MAESLYLHVPFCEKICSYCDFARCRYHEGLAKKWFEAVKREINERKIEADLKTIYIGGGTPTALSTDLLEKLLKLLQPYTNAIQEYTIEANIENLSDEKIRLMKKYGINRISLGIQTLNPRLLKIINRSHSVEEVEKTVSRLYHNGIQNISIDLIYGLPTQTMEEWRADLNWVLKQSFISHVSLYSLTIEENSKFGREHVTGVDPELEGMMYEVACQLLKENGFNHYEISNFAKKDCESQHNQCYWRYDDFYGIGCGASGKENHVRYTHPFQLNDYCNNDEKLERIELCREDEMFECIMMNLRTHKGLSINHFNQLFSTDLLTVYQEAIATNINKKWLFIENNHLRPTEAGMQFLNDVLLEFMD